MDKRFFIALGLSIVLMVLVQRVFPTPAKKPVPGQQASPTAQASPTSRPTQAGAQTPSAAAPLVERLDTAQSAPTPGAGDTVVVRTPRLVYRFGTVGAAPVGVTVSGFKSMRPGTQGPVELTRPGTPLVRFQLRSGGVAIPLDRTPFAV